MPTADLETRGRGPKLRPRGKVGVSQTHMRLSPMEECHNGGLIWKHALSITRSGV